MVLERPDWLKSINEIYAPETDIVSGDSIKNGTEETVDNDGNTVITETVSSGGNQSIESMKFNKKRNPDGTFSFYNDETGKEVNVGELSKEELATAFENPEMKEVIKRVAGPLKPFDVLQPIHEAQGLYSEDAPVGFHTYLAFKNRQIKEKTASMMATGLSPNFLEEMRKDDSGIAEQFGDMLDSYMSMAYGGTSKLSDLRSMGKTWLANQPEEVREKFEFKQADTIGVREDNGKNAAIDFLSKKFMAREKAESEITDLLDDAAKRTAEFKQNQRSPFK
tara:strand:- start:6105 stop:6941 length:837 start_codon:yes stop_codon:yes gene_type:complete